MKTIWWFICWIWDPVLPGVAAIFGLFYFLRLSMLTAGTDGLGTFISACSLTGGTFVCRAGVRLIQSMILRVVRCPDLFKKAKN